jgi:predicted  nucleic acid-binding Zn-ribbon protein
MSFFLIPAALVELGLSVYAFLSCYKYHQHVKTGLKKKNTALQAENERIAQRIEAQEQDGYDLAMQIKFKGKELCDMTTKFNSVSKELGKANQHCKVLQKELDEVSKSLAQKENEIELFRHRELGYKKHTASFTYERVMRDEIIERKEEETKDLQITIRLLKEGDKLRDHRIKGLETLIRLKDDAMDAHISEKQQLTTKTQTQRTALDVAQAMIIEKVAAHKAKQQELQLFQDKLTERIYDVEYLNQLLLEKDAQLSLQQDDIQHLSTLLEEKEAQVFAWWNNTPPTIHALQSQIEELGAKLDTMKGLYRNQIQAGKQVVGENDVLRVENEMLVVGLREVAGAFESFRAVKRREAGCQIEREAECYIERQGEWQGLERLRLQVKRAQQSERLADNDVSGLEPLAGDDEVGDKMSLDEKRARELMAMVRAFEGLKEKEEKESFAVVDDESDGDDCYDDLPDLEPMDGDCEEELVEYGSEESWEIERTESEFEMVSCEEV